ncbi:MAG: hypothetical protein ACI8SE_001514 [Bacteroidia bacterium]|jgi:hypothetical protein
MKAIDSQTLWVKLKQFVLTFSLVFCLGFILCFPINPTILSDIQGVVTCGLSPVIGLLNNLTYHDKTLDLHIFSDSKSMYLLVLLLACLSFISTSVAHIFKLKVSAKTVYWLRTIIKYYIAYQLLHYGFNKMFKWQFFLPEPNVVYAQLGTISKDLLYWSAIGSSYWYTVIAGCLEVVAGFLLFFRKTQKAGLMLALVLFSNIVLVNFTFNISVKLFSLFLLFATFILFSQYLNQFLAFLFNRQVRPINNYQPDFKTTSTLYSITKSIVVLLLVLDSLWLYGKTSNWNDDIQSRPLLHGAYETSLNQINDWAAVYVNRKGYLISENQAGLKVDFQLAYDTTNHFLSLDRPGQSLILQYDDSNQKVVLTDSEGDSIVLKKLPYTDLPLFQKSFDWWID